MTTAYAAKDAEILRLRAENQRLRAALEEIKSRHIPDQPASSGGNEAEWVIRQYRALRQVARAALAAENVTAYEAKEEGL